MHIEKINDQKIKCILSHEELQANDLKMSELAFGSEKAQNLFMDMIEEAYEKFGFDPHNGPLMIEAIPLDEDAIMIILTKVASPAEMEDKLKELEIFDATKKKPRKNSARKRNLKNNILLYSFEDLEEIITLNNRVSTLKNYKSTLYTHQGTYYLLIEKIPTKSMKSLECILSEYGEKQVYNPIVQGWFNEHTELLIKEKALEILSTYFT